MGAQSLKRWIDPRAALSAKAALLLGLISGVLIFLSWPDYNFYPLCLIGLVPLIWVSNHSKLRFRWVWLSGHVTALTLMIGGFPWIQYVMVEFGELPVWLSWVLFLLYACVAALNFPIYLTIQTALIRRYGPVMNWLHAPTFLIVEWLFPKLFPWYLGCPMVGWLPFVQSAEIWGVYGLTFLVVAINAFFAMAAVAIVSPAPDLRRWTRLAGMGLLVVVAANIAFGVSRISLWQNRIAEGRESNGLNVAVIQANVTNIQKRSDQRRMLGESVIDRYVDQTRALKGHTIDLVIWPEVAIARFFLNSRPLQQRFFSLADEVNAYLFFGSLREEPASNQIFNSSFLIGPGNRLLGFYDKIYLLMFGEFVPFGELFPRLKTLVPAISDFSRGSGPVILETGRFQFAPLICYESIVIPFVQEIMQRQSPPDFLVNITNDSWFGSMNEPEQHLLLTRFRAIEYRVPLVRAVNTGISAVIDQTGALVKRAELNTVSTLEDRITIVPDHRTAVANYGNWFSIAVAIAFGFVLIYFEWRQRLYD